jgi:hypothetical protein
MISFFRKIRQQFLEKNKMGNYFKYAFGEIFLVVIGILIAISINGWNESRRLDNLEHEYYCRLLEDAQQDLEQINQFITLSQDRLAASNEAVRLLQKGNAKKVEVGKQLGLSILAIYSDFTPNNSAFEDLKSGANLNIIKDKDIIKSINNYYKKVEGYLSIVQVNATIALDRYYLENDLFESGQIHSQMLTERFITGMEKDVYDSMGMDYEEKLSEAMSYKLLNGGLTYISSNARQLQLYEQIKEEVVILIQVLEPKCMVQ